MDLQHTLAAQVYLNRLGPPAKPMVTLHQVEIEILGQVADVQSPLIAADRLLPVVPQRFGGAQELAPQPLPGGEGPGFPLFLAQIRSVVQDRRLLGLPDGLRMRRLLSPGRS